jgi:hypothetical protein
VGARFLDLCLEGKYKTIRYTMYSKKQSIYLRTGFNGWARGMMKSSKGLENNQQLFSNVCVCVLFVSKFYYLTFQEQVP